MRPILVVPQGDAVVFFVVNRSCHFSVKASLICLMTRVLSVAGFTSDLK